MSQSAAERSSAGRAQASTGAETRLRGRWLLMARSVWLLVAIGEFANFLIGIPAYYVQLNTVCTTDLTQCTFNNLPTPANVQALHHLGLQLSVYAALSTCIVVLVALIGRAVGIQQPFLSHRYPIRTGSLS